MSILEQIGFKQRKHIGISISANNFVELVQIDKTTKSVIKYSSDNIKYNSSIREVVDYDELAESIDRLFEDVGLNPKECSVSLSIPNVHFGITSLENNTDTMYITENIQADIEDLYIFKRNEPAIGFAVLDNGITKGQKNIVFSAIQTKVVAKLLEIFDKLEADIVRIDTAYSSLFKAIQYCDKFSKYVLPDEKTTIILVTPNSCCAFFMVGPVIADVIEEPLAVKSFSSEEVYSAIAKIATNSILKNSPKSLLIISETDEVDAEVLSQKLDFNGEVDFINKSINNNTQFIDVYGVGSDIDSNMISYMTIEAVGNAASDFDEYPLNLNFIPKERIQNNIVEVGAYEVPFNKYLTFIIAVAVLTSAILGLAINSFCSYGISKKQNEKKENQEKINIFNKTIASNQQYSKVDLLPVMTEIVNKNRAIIDAYMALSSDIPESVYIKNFVTQSNGGIGILGEAKSGESVDLFVKNLKEKNNDLMLTKLSINAQNENIHSKIQDGYTFEIKTPDKNVIFIDNNFQNNQSGNRNILNNVKGYGGNSSNMLLPPPSPII